jgi:hypothetical protein
MPVDIPVIEPTQAPVKETTEPIASTTLSKETVPRETEAPAATEIPKGTASHKPEIDPD